MSIAFVLFCCLSLIAETKVNDWILDASKTTFKSEARCGVGPQENKFFSECKAVNNPCCSYKRYCGNTTAHCNCEGCVDFSKSQQYRMDLVVSGDKHSGTWDKIKFKLRGDRAGDRIKTNGWTKRFTWKGKLDGGSTERLIYILPKNLGDLREISLETDGEDVFYFERICINPSESGYWEVFDNSDNVKLSKAPEEGGIQMWSWTRTIRSRNENPCEFTENLSYGTNR